MPETELLVIFLLLHSIGPRQWAVGQFNLYVAIPLEYVSVPSVHLFLDVLLLPFTKVQGPENRFNKGSL